MTNQFWSRYAAFYDALCTIIPYRQLIETIYTHAAPQPGERLLNAGCGTGNFDAYAAKHMQGMQLDAIDFSPGMLVRAREKCRSFPHVAHHEANLCDTIPFADHTFDLAVMCNVLYTLPDGLRAMQEIHRVLKPGGRFVLCDRGPDSNISPVWKEHLAAIKKQPLGERVLSTLKTASIIPILVGVALANATIDRQKQHGAYHYYSEEEVIALAERAGFRIVHTQPAYAEQNLLLRMIRC